MTSRRYLELSDIDRNARRKTISIHNSVEKLDKHQSLLINKLRVLAAEKGMTFEIVGKSEDNEGETRQKKKTTPKNYTVSCILEAPDIADSGGYEELSSKKKEGKNHNGGELHGGEALLGATPPDQGA